MGRQSKYLLPPLLHGDLVVCGLLHAFVPGLLVLRNALFEILYESQTVFNASDRVDSR